MNNIDFLFEASPQKSPNPIKTSELKDFFSQFSVGDNLYIKRSNGDNINISITKKNSEFDYDVRKGKDNFSILCQSDSRNNGASVFVVREFDQTTKKNKFYKYTDIQYITLSDKKTLSKVIFDINTPTKNNPTQPNANNNNNTNTNQNPSPTPPNGNGNTSSDMIDKVLERLKNKLEPIAYNILVAYYKQTDNLKDKIKQLNGNIEAFITKQMGSNSTSTNSTTNNPTPQFISLSNNMEYQNGIWVTTNNLSNQYKSTPQKFAGSPKEVKQNLIDVLAIIKTKDLLNLVVSSTERYNIMVDVSPSKTVSFKAVSPNRDISVTQNKSYAGKQYKLTQLSTDYTQPEIIKIGNKNKLVLPLYVNGRINPSNFVHELEGINSFTYTPSSESVMEETIFNFNSNLINSLDGLGEETKVIITYNVFDNNGDSTQQTLSMIVKAKDNLYIIDGASISELNGKSIAKDSILPSYSKADTSKLSGSVLQTIEGLALGNLISVDLHVKNEEGDYEDNAREISDVEFTDEELYQTIMDEPILRDFMIKKPSFWDWIKHKKNDFNGAKLDMDALQTISNKINSKYNGRMNPSDFVSNDFFRLKVDDTNGKDGTYENNYIISDGMNMTIKVKSSNNKTEMYVYKTRNSKPSLILVTKDSVFDVQNNAFTSKKFSAVVSDSKGKIGTMLFTVV